MADALSLDGLIEITQPSINTTSQPQEQPQQNGTTTSPTLASTLPPTTKPTQLPDGEWTPETVLATLPERPVTDSTSPIPFFHALTLLKTTPREGWRRFGIHAGESIADHMYRMSIITLLCPPSLAATLDIPRCTRMALVHDMAEALVGDITPIDGVSKPEKSRREGETMDFLCGGLLGRVGGGRAGEGIREVWQEYEDGVTRESVFVHDVDKVELLLQMVEYEKAKGGELDLGEFAWVAKRIVMPEVKEWAEEILQERKAYWEGRGKVPGGVGSLGGESEEAVLSEERKEQQDEYYGEDKKVNGVAGTDGVAETSTA
ncbi:hypothetical protein LTR56_003482 [Elasticomyces elasticus]|nr:hypothetical protein LTR22_010958 [Elasticomyces elasticus]KAK3655475.1 hypothetical protein LTR56_003482 [Elasticomyces elasticus]KAK4919888.1 hypothetical protein LTR49_012485 [Elasticomyces elasticus]KAK5756730.1 hypothetical protein LTS12_013194 [Elasticomyces elasticus]